MELEIRESLVDNCKMCWGIRRKGWRSFDYSIKGGTKL